MSYGILIRNPEGKILIDGERKMPKLLHHNRYYLQTQGHDSAIGYTWYADVNFTPTNKPVFVTQAVDETVPYAEDRAYLRTPIVYRNAQSQFYRVRLEAIGRYNGWGKIYVFVWVYEI